MTDERRYDFLDDEAFTPGERRTITWTVTEKQTDGTFDPATDFASYSDWEFYQFQTLDDGGPTQAERQAKAIYYLAEPAGVVVGAAPTVTTVHGSLDTAKVRPGRVAYEFWVKVSDEWTRLRYGTMPFVD